MVIGGGIAGLASAYNLAKNSAGLESRPQIVLLEAADQWGGKMITTLHDGFVVEGGPDTFLATKPWAVQLCRELGIAERLQGTNPEQRSTYVLKDGRLEPLSDGLTMMIPTDFGSMIRTQLLSWPQKARMGLDFLLPPQPPNGDESLGAFVTRRLGRAAYERLIEPLMSGIYAGDGDQLSLKATFPYLRDLEREHGGLVKGALYTRRQRAKSRPAAGQTAGRSRSVFLTPRAGLQEIVQALVDYLTAHGADLRLGAAAQAVTRRDEGYIVTLQGGEQITADGVALATPAYVTGRLLRGLDAELADDLTAIPYASTATVSLAYRAEDLARPLDGYGYVIPRREGRKALACTWTSTKFPHRAPEGHALLRVFIGRAGQDLDLSTDEQALLEIALEEVRLTLGIKAPPLAQWVFYWDRAMPQYNLGHPQRLERIENRLAEWPGLALAGNGYRGIGIPDCIYSGEQAAAALLAAVAPEKTLA